jgi:hypothetical protein
VSPYICNTEKFDLALYVYEHPRDQKIEISHVNSYSRKTKSSDSESLYFRRLIYNAQFTSVGTRN